MKLCKIIAPSNVDYEYLRPFLSKYPIILTQDTNSLDDSVPTQIIGWSHTKSLYPSQSILEKAISHNQSWTYSKDEDEKNFLQDIEFFINTSIKAWLPKEFVIFDPVFEQMPIEDFIKQNFDLSQRTYLYFHSGALYMRNAERNIIFNIKSFLIYYPDYRQILTDFLNKVSCMCFSYKNISKYVYLERLNCTYTLENVRWVKYKSELTEQYFQIIPGMDVKKYIPFVMSKVDNFTFTDDEKRSLRRACERDVITEWLSNRLVNFKKGFTGNLKFVTDGDNKLARINYSDKRTLTGRIVSSDGYNPQNLDKKTDARAQIISKFKNGRIVVLDYTSFEARIALYFCGDEEFIKKFFDKDLHVETAKIIFGKETFTVEERDFAKIINHSILYGASKGTVLEKLSYLGNAEQIYYWIREFLAPLLKVGERLKEDFLLKGYIVNDWGTIVYPEKEHAIFSNYISSSATEILVDKLYEVKDLLVSYKSGMLFQVHDSLVFDIHPDEKEVVEKLIGILSNYKHMRFALNYSFGSDYKNLSREIMINLENRK